jgi:hypothetical protein
MEPAAEEEDTIVALERDEMCGELHLGPRRLDIARAPGKEP